MDVQINAAAVPPKFYDCYLANTPADQQPTIGSGEAITPEFQVELKYATYSEDGSVELTPAVIDPNRYICWRVRSEARAREIAAQMPWCVGCVSDGEVVFGTGPRDADQAYLRPFG